MSSGTERRRHVRLKPSAEVPARVALLGDGVLREALDIVDISVDGIALTSSVLRNTEPGARLQLRISVCGSEEHAIVGVVRWALGEVVGVEIADATPAAAQAISRYVSELLERGGSA